MKRIDSHFRISVVHPPSCILTKKNITKKKCCWFAWEETCWADNFARGLPIYTSKLHTSQMCLSTKRGFWHILIYNLQLYTYVLYIYIYISLSFIIYIVQIAQPNFTSKLEFTLAKIYYFDPCLTRKDLTSSCPNSLKYTSIAYPGLLYMDHLAFSASAG